MLRRRARVLRRWPIVPSRERKLFFRSVAPERVFATYIRRLVADDAGALHTGMHTRECARARSMASHFGSSMAAECRYPTINKRVPFAGGDLQNNNQD